MTRAKWLDLADEWERKALAAEQQGDELWAEVLEARANACRFCADFGTDDETVAGEGGEENDG